jgi:hypothetical protein
MTLPNEYSAESDTSSNPGESDELARRRELRRRDLATVAADVVRSAPYAEQVAALKLAQVGSVLGTQVIRAFGDTAPFNNRLVQAAVTGLPPLLALPETAASPLKDTKWLGLAGAVGLAALDEFLESRKEANEEIATLAFDPQLSALPSKQEFPLKAVAKNKDGQPIVGIKPEITTVSGVDPSSKKGFFEVTAAKGGVAVLTATATDAKGKEASAALTIMVT